MVWLNEVEISTKNWEVINKVRFAIPFGIHYSAVAILSFLSDIDT